MLSVNHPLTYTGDSTAFEIFAYQRSDGGQFSVTVDGGASFTVDFYNKTSTGDDPPVLLYAATGLSNQTHTIQMTNLLDSRVGKYGQLNVSDGLHYSHMRSSLT